VSYPKFRRTANCSPSPKPGNTLTNIF
jgi:hypothetical protein